MNLDSHIAAMETEYRSSTDLNASAREQTAHDIFSHPCVALVNGMSGSRKGEKVIRILRLMGMTTFDLIELSSNDKEMESLSSFLLELFRTCRKTASHVRVLVCGGDGSVGWALSTLDRALLDPRIFKFFQRNAQELGLPPILIDRPTHFAMSPLVSPAPLTSSRTFSFDEERCKHFAKVAEIAAEPFSPSTDLLRLQLNVQEDGEVQLELCLQLPELTIKKTLSHSNSENALSKDDGDEFSPPEELLTAETSVESRPTTPNRSSAPRLTKEEYAKLIFEKQVSSRHIQNIHHQQRFMLDAIYVCKIAPLIGVLPLGTGNDLSRCLGSGNNYPQSKNLPKFVGHFLQDKMLITKLDRWHVSFLDENGARKHRQASQMMCYFSVGYTAEISHEFQLARMTSPSKFDKRWKNKLQYIKQGTKTLLQKQEAPLESYVTLIVDGKEVKIKPSAKSLAICNISSMGDGINFWGTTPSTRKELQDWIPPELGDGQLEVMSSTGLPQYLQMCMGLKRAFRIAQATHVSVILNESLPIDVDGEAWEETPGRIDFFLQNAVLALVGPKEDLARGLSIVEE